MSMDYIDAYGEKALIVTDEAMVNGNVKKLTDELDRVGKKYIIFPGINTEPTHSMIDEGVKIYGEEECDFLIGIGGGSPLDAMKAIGAVVTNGGSITEYMGKVIEKIFPLRLQFLLQQEPAPRLQKFLLSPTQTQM